MQNINGGTELKVPERFIELVGSDHIIYKQFKCNSNYYYYCIVEQTLFHGHDEEEIYQKILKYSKDKFDELNNNIYCDNNIWVDHMKWYFANLKSKNKK